MPFSECVKETGPSLEYFKSGPGTSKTAKSDRKSTPAFVAFVHFRPLQIALGLWGKIGCIASMFYYLLLLTTEITLLNRIYGVATEQNN